MRTLLPLAACLLAVSIPIRAQEKKPELPQEKIKPSEDPLKTAERIAQNAQEVGKRLAEKDPGKDTRNIQDEIVKDIDALIRKAQEPPPSSDAPKPPPMGGMGENSQTKPDGGTGSPPTPSGGSSRAGRQQRRQHGGESSPKTANDSPMPQPRSGLQSTGKGGSETWPAQPRKADPTGMNARTPDVYKDVWGHLPEKMRQEMDLYYREQFIPRYSELLKQYYSSLAERDRKNP